MLNHRFIEELELLEKEQIFCGEKVEGTYNFLIIGTFNPDDNAFPDPTNDAEWFYGRTTPNRFWEYFPTAYTNESLHPRDGITEGPPLWREYCRNNKVVIIDMVKKIHHPGILNSQSDRELNSRINTNLDNVEYFNVKKAFKKTKFNKVIYSLKWTDERNIPNLVSIRNKINQNLIRQGTIQNNGQIRYALAPWRNAANTYLSWHDAVNL